MVCTVYVRFTSILIDVNEWILYKAKILHYYLFIYLLLLFYYLFTFFKLCVYIYFNVNNILAIKSLLAWPVKDTWIYIHVLMGKHNTEMYITVKCIFFQDLLRIMSRTQIGYNIWNNAVCGWTAMNQNTQPRWAVLLNSHTHTNTYVNDLTENPKCVLRVSVRK